MTARPSSSDGVPSPRSSRFFNSFQSLKGKSLADSLQVGSPYQISPTDDYFKLQPGQTHQNPGRVAPPSHVDLPTIPLGAELALTALQYLPTPLLVLSDLKTVILANDAMGLLLGLNKYEVEDGKDTEQQERDVAVGDLLEGQTLNQIGVDMVQDGQSIWVNWEVSRMPECLMGGPK